MILNDFDALKDAKMSIFAGWRLICIVMDLCVFETLWFQTDPQSLISANRIDGNKKLQVLVILFFGFHIYLMMKALTWGTGGHVFFACRLRRLW